MEMIEDYKAIIRIKISRNHIVIYLIFNFTEIHLPE